MFNYGDTTRARRVFYVAALVCSFFAQWLLCYCGSQTMVAQAGQPSGWPV
ncbi:hypothetical protein CDA58_02980, partial [Serratia marcescens]